MYPIGRGKGADDDRGTVVAVRAVGLSPSIPSCRARANGVCVMEDTIFGVCGMADKILGIC